MGSLSSVFLVRRAGIVPKPQTSVWGELQNPRSLGEALNDMLESLIHVCPPYPIVLNREAGLSKVKRHSSPIPLTPPRQTL